MIEETRQPAARRRRRRPNRRRKKKRDTSLGARNTGGGGPSKPLGPQTGVAEILPKGFGFLRQLARCYQSSPEDLFVPAGLVRQHRLVTGSEVTGEGVLNNGRAQLKSILTINGLPPEKNLDLEPFNRLTSIDPFQRLNIAGSNDPAMRILDLVTPIGKGQRGLIVAPPRTGKTILLQKLAQNIVQFHPEVRVIVLLIDERPEEVTEMKRTVDAEVVYSSNDESVERHVRVVEIVLEHARRLVEAGTDVVILLDSLTRVARAYNNNEKSRGRTLSGGLGASTLAKPREFFGAARKIEHGASLTIIATALIDTGSRMDDVIFEEFKGTGNMELMLHRGLADRRTWPAVDINKSGTRKEEKLRTPDEQYKVNLIRRALADRPPEEALQLLLAKVEKTQSNEQFLKLLKS